MAKNKLIHTERLVLKPTSEDDAAFILALLNTPKWLLHIGDRNVKTIESAAIYIKERMLPQLKKLGYSDYTVLRKSDGVKLGTCGLYSREGVEGIDIGFAFLPEYEKNGYAFEAANQLKRIAFTAFGIKEIRAYTTKENISSQQLLEKLGLQFQGTSQLPNAKKPLLQYTLKV